jgi:Domain of unknown function (DUF4403)
MRRQFISFALAIAMFAAGPYGSAANGEDQVSLEPSESPGATKDSSVEEHSQNSTILVPFRISLADLSARLNSMVADGYQGDDPVSVPGATDGHASFEVRRGEFVLSSTESGSIGISANVSVRGLCGYRFQEPKSVHYRTPLYASAIVTGEAHPTVVDEWLIRPNLQTHVEVRAAQIGGFDASAFAADRISSAIPAAQLKAADELNRQFSLRDKMSASWGTAFKTIQLTKDPSTFVQFSPRSVRITQPQVTRDGFVELGASMECELSLVVADRATEQVPSMLPPPTVLPSLDDKFKIYVPVAIPLKDVAKRLRVRTSRDALKIVGIGAIKLMGVRFGSEGNGLVVRAAIEASNTGGDSHFKGELAIQGEPVISSSGENIGFDRLEYTEESRSELRQRGVWLLQPAVLEKLKSALLLDLKDEISIANEYADQELKSRLKSDGLESDIDISSLHATRVFIVGDQLLVAFLVNGKCKLIVNS